MRKLPHNAKTNKKKQPSIQKAQEPRKEPPPQAGPPQGGATTQDARQSAPTITGNEDSVV